MQAYFIIKQEYFVNKTVKNILSRQTNIQDSKKVDKITNIVRALYIQY